MNAKNKTKIIATACADVSRALEQLEHRQMFANTVQTLPFNLTFNQPVNGTLLDKNGRGIGLTAVQANKAGDQYQPSLIDLDTTNGVLKLTTRGNSVNGSAGGLDNSLTNGLETGFNGNQRGFTINTRVVGPITNLNDRFEQAGIYFGADQDNYTKLVVGRNWNGQFLSFEDEFTNSTGGVSSTRNGTNAQTDIGSFASINTIDLRIVGDAATGTVSAYYRINSSTGSYTKVGYDITIAPERRSTFFNAASRAGLIAQHKNDVGPITAAFDSFSITAGTPILARPSVANIQGMTGTAIDVRRDTAVRANLTLANGGTVDASTLTSSNVKLYRTGDRTSVAATLSTISSGTGIVISPSALLDPNTTYTVEVTGGLQDSSGASFQPFLMSFTTGSASGTSNDIASGPQANFNTSALFFSDISSTASGGSGTSLVQKIRITNTGVGNLVLGTGSLQFGGTNGGEFQLGGSVSLPLSIEPGAYADIPVVFNAGAVGIRTGTLTISTNDTTLPAKAITLRGLGTAGAGGNLEPSLQRILDTYQIPVNVGDTTPDTTDIPATTAGEQLDIERLRKAGAGSVTVEILANFANSTSPSTRFGYYSAGQLADRTQLFTVGTASAQTLRPVTDGSLSFDPTGEFGLYTEFPAFANRIAASEKVYNTWETVADRQVKMRFYALKDANGNVVPHAYIFTAEDWNVNYDANDIVGIIRNVDAAPAGPEISLINTDGVPATDHLLMSRIRDIQVVDPTNNYIANTVHDHSTLRITNTGNQPLNVSGISINNSDFIVESGGGAFTLATGETRDVVVKFVFDRTGLGNEIRTANLTVTSNDNDTPSQVVKLSGLWQSYSENSPQGQSQEPTAETVVQAFGYNVNLGTLNTHGAISRAGEEILSEMWQSADGSKPVAARQLAAYHQEKSTTNSRIRYLPLGASGVGTTIFTHLASDGQTLLPRLNGSTTAPAYGEFTPTSIFSWTVDSDQSIDSRNTTAYNPAGFPSSDGGHALRFYAAKDSNGKIIPNTFILIMDYVGQSYSNYDYQDNIYLLTNVKPVSGPAAPAGAVAYAGGGPGNALAWFGNTEGNLAGYNVYRSTSSGGTYTKINGNVLTGTTYSDNSALVGVTYYYQIRAIDVNGTEGASSTVSTTRTADTIAPAAPSYPTAQGTTSGNALNWLDNNEPDLAGYNVYRASAVDGTYTKLNNSPLSSSDYLDLSAPGAASSFYRVTAVDFSGNESVAAPLSAYRPASGNVPNAPTSLASSSSTTSSVTLAWTDNANDETGFIIERKNTDGTWSQVGTTGSNVTTFTNTGLQGGTAYTYRVRATNNAGPSAYSNELTATTQQSAPAAPTGLGAVALTATAVKLTWTDNATNETGYRIERRIGTSGTWATLDTVGTNITLYVDQSATASTNYNYRVTATNSVGASAASNIATITTPAADGYSSVDIGGPVTAGSTSVINAGKDYDITAGGTDVWANADQFRFVYKAVTGDFDYSARITDVSQADIGSMGGLMARETLNADSRHIFMRARVEGMRANYRLATGGSSVGVGGVAFTYPNAYVRLQRVGNVFTAYASTDGQSWTMVTQQTMAMSSTLFFGMAVSARTTTTATTTAKVRELTDRNAVATPDAPTNLIGSADATPKATLYWADNATNETGYRVERRLAGTTTWSTIATIGADSTTYADYSVSLGQQYVYRVFATSVAGDSLASNELTVTVSNSVPSAPSNLLASNIGTGIRLDWIDNSSNESNFQIERRLSSGTTWSQIGLVSANATTYTDSGITAGASYVYRVRALGAAADSAYSSEFSISAPTTLPFTSVDIGGAAGGATQVVTDGTAYNMTASGTDVWNSADQFRFAYRAVTGDFDIRVRVSALGYTSDQSMAGLMARASLDANSRNVFVKDRADGTQRMTYRSNTAGTTAGIGSGTTTFPNGWLRLTRVGNTFTGFGSADGVSWVVISSVTLSLPTTMYVGLATASHVTGVTTTAQFRDLTLA